MGESMKWSVTSCPGGHPQLPNHILTMQAGLPISPAPQLEKPSLKAACCKRAPNSPLLTEPISPGRAGGWLATSRRQLRLVATHQGDGRVGGLGTLEAFAQGL